MGTGSNLNEIDLLKELFFDVVFLSFKQCFFLLFIYDIYIYIYIYICIFLFKYLTIFLFILLLFVLSSLKMY